MKRFFAFDLIILAYLAITSLIVVVHQPLSMWNYLGYHAALVAIVFLVTAAHERYWSPFWEWVRYWYAIPVVLCSFREIHFLFVDPECPPFEARGFDSLLASIDRAVLGDVDAFFLSLAQPQFIDFLHVCYMSYFVLIVAPAIIPFFRGERAGVREAMATIVGALYLSYLGYFLVPAVGPHHFFPERPAQLDGWILGGAMYEALMAMELRTPDAFPSGHTLASVTALCVAWRRHRQTFWVILIPATGLVWATMALRYHYVVDVAAAMALVPVAFFGGILFNGWWERRRGSEYLAGRGVHPVRDPHIFGRSVGSQED